MRYRQQRLQHLKRQRAVVDNALDNLKQAAIDALREPEPGVTDGVADPSGQCKATTTDDEATNAVAGRAAA